MSSGFFSKWLKVSLVAFVGAGFLAVVFYALWMKDEIRSAQVEPPLIVAPEIPVKHRPDQPGGMNIPNRDKVVFDLLDVSSSSLVSGDLPVVSETGVAEALSPTLLKTTSVSSVVSTSVPSNTSDSVVVSLSEIRKPVDSKILSSTVASSVAVSKKDNKLVDKPFVSETKKPVNALSKDGGDSSKLKTKTWGVQLAAVGSKADAEKVASSLKGKNPALKSLTLKVGQAGPAKFRVQFWGLKDRAAASAVCAKVSPCFPVAP